MENTDFQLSMGARRLSAILASPYKAMERVAEKVADFIVPDAVAPPVFEDMSPTPAVEENKASPAKKRSAPAAKTLPSKKVVVKKEAERDLPFRSRRTHKVGFYNEKNLTQLAWRGTGSASDPIRFDD